jgi:hypothetical protein
MKHRALNVRSIGGSDDDALATLGKRRIETCAPPSDRISSDSKKPAAVSGAG